MNPTLYAPIEPATIALLNGVPEAITYDDVYFSRDDGIAESTYNYLDGNNLAMRFSHTRQRFTIAETGFGTGLNFLLTARLWRQRAAASATLHYISIDKHPIDKKTLATCLTAFPSLAGDACELLQHYPLCLPGAHTFSLADGRIQLTLLWCDAASACQHIRAHSINGWYLDGFAPAKNPEIWHPSLLSAMHACSAPHATVASFTAASAVRTGLHDAGFMVTKRAGYGRKRHMIIASTSAAAPAPPAPIGDVIIIGAGIAGSSAAYACAQRGLTATIIERAPAPAQAASGNPAGILYPYMATQWDAPTSFYLSGLSHTIHSLHTLKSSGARYNLCGMHHTPKRPDDPDALVSLHAPIHQLKLPFDLYHTTPDGTHMPCSGWVDIPSVCAAMLSHHAITTYYDHTASQARHDGTSWQITCSNGNTHRATALIIANAHDAAQLFPEHTLPMSTIAGQITYLPETATRNHPDHVLCYGGYSTPSINGHHVIGATFHKESTSRTVTQEDHRANLLQLQRHHPAILPTMPDITALQGRTALRTVSADRFPMIGKLHDERALRAILSNTHYNKQYAANMSIPLLPNCYVTLAHAARGMVSAPLAADMIANALTHAPMQHHPSINSFFAPERFLLRQWRKGTMLHPITE